MSFFANTIIEAMFLFPYFRFRSCAVQLRVLIDTTLRCDRRIRYPVVASLAQWTGWGRRTSSGRVLAGPHTDSEVDSATKQHNNDAHSTNECYVNVTNLFI